MTINPKHYIGLCLAAVCTLASAQTEFDPVIVTDPGDGDTTSTDTDDLGKGAANATLGGYLDNMPNVDSASYGEAVGRPVVRGMSGYRIKILHNDNDLSDLSAMSQDHAVAVAPRASERIELFKGPASLLYAAQAGGVIRIGDALDSLFLHSGFNGELSGNLRAGPQSYGADGHIHYADDTWAAHLGALTHDSDPYETANGQTVADSDLSTQQAQLGLGWRPGSRSEWQLNATWLQKDYGIPNDTTEATRIDMQRTDIGAAFRYQPDLEWLDLASVDISGSDYLHDETEGASKDGLFGQKQLNATLNLEWVISQWSGRSRLSLGQNELRVCHEHDACDDFSTASRNGGPLGESTLQSYENTGYAYSHGHPMPDTENQTLQLSSVARRMLSPQHELSLGAHSQWRQLTPDPANIQQQWVHPQELDPDHYQRKDDQTFSLSLGIARQITGNALLWEASLSYIERSPSADELYWNGFHHATETYIFGDVDLNKESSVNADFDLVLRHNAHRAQLSTFYYRFNDYIYQDQGYDANGDPLIDPFHLSEVWFTRQSDADFLGASLRYEYQLMTRFNWPVMLWTQADVLSAKASGGDNLPRTAPANASLGMVFETESWLASITVKRVFKADQLAENETSTPGYTWLSGQVQKTWPLQDSEFEVWLKGDNLLDDEARNHLSVLKDTAPLPGRQIVLGANWNF